MELDEILELERYGDNIMMDIDGRQKSSSSIERSNMSYRTEHVEEQGDKDVVQSISSKSTEVDLQTEASVVDQLLQRIGSCSKASTSNSAPLQGTARARLSLKAIKDPHSSIAKRRPQQYCNGRIRPIIIHTYSPKIIHTSLSKFMWLVQSLTGSPETRFRACSKLQQSTQVDYPLHHPHPRRHLPFPAAPMEAPQQAVIMTPTPVYPYPPLDRPQIGSPNSNASQPFVHNMYYTPAKLISANGQLPNQHCNLSISLDKCRTTNYSEQKSSLCLPVSQCSVGASGGAVIDVSPRGPLSASESSEDYGGKLAAPFMCKSVAAATITPSAPKFESWDSSNDRMMSSLDNSVHSNSSISSLLQEMADANLLVLDQSNSDNYTHYGALSVGFSELLPSEYSLIHAQQNWANGVPPIPMWDSYPIETFLHSLQDI
ncbi:hypothetical protein GOP47_0017051 [Adiantum capillus-veneris]|uniref:VQ domain-containing protein n=1 Tax=Adiantum capillus-veneris TaxID=13818 RepID=A0A9D4UIV3_ADICA|nr:hypothetical protein GOP47_0017051 [Adiantum capillus-veneris]